jgi:hypothetical protein
MSPPLLNWLTDTLGGRHVSALTAVSVVASCAVLGVTIGLLFPMRSLGSRLPRALSIQEHLGFKETPQASIENFASPILPTPETAASPGHEGPHEAVSPSRPHRVAGKGTPIETDKPCRWSQSQDGTLTCAGRQVMIPDAGDPLRTRQCGMVFHDKVRFSGIDVRVVSSRTKGNPFLVRSPDDWRVNFDAPNATTVRVIFRADAPESGIVVCQFSYHLQKVQ